MNDKSIFEYAKEKSNKKILNSYAAFKVLLEGIDCIVCLESAADLLGYSNGGYRDQIYVYTTKEINLPYIKSFIVNDLNEIVYITYKDIKVTPIEKTINDMLNRDESDDQILFETFANYYFKNNCSYDKLKIKNSLLKKAKIYKEGGKDYYATY